MPLVCCQLIRKGRFVVGEPWFEHGNPITVASGKHYLGDAGKLVLLAVNGTLGRVVEVLGDSTDVRASLRGLLAETGALGPVPPPGMPAGTLPRKVQRQVEELADGVPGLAQREDLRAHVCVTIDPPTARDFDDAIGVEQLMPDDDAAPGGWRVWVHIADVAAYVATGSPLDIWAAERAMSAYVPGQVAPMLPQRLSNDLCSLRPGVDRGCVSVELIVDAEGGVASRRFARTVIRSARRLAYDQVDEVLAGERKLDPVVDEQLAMLDALTGTLRTARMKRGALDLAMGDVEFTLDDDGRPVAAHRVPESPSHRLVEECMLLANDAVGQYLAQRDALGIWRIHEHPDPESILALMRTFEALDVPTPPIPDPDQLAGRAGARIAAEAVRLATRFAEQRGRGRKAFPTRVLRALQRAAYQAESGPHSGLATNDYAHFTSPIRRYPDLVVHRSLLRELGVSTQPPAADDLVQVALHVSEVERDLQRLEYRADDIVLADLLHQHLYLNGEAGDNPDGSWSGEVTGMIAPGLFVRFGDIYEGFVPARTLGGGGRGDRWYLSDDGLAMEATRSGARIRLGDALNVYVDRIDRSRGKVDLRRC